MSTQDIINRACDPRVGDRMIGLDGITTITVRAVEHGLVTYQATQDDAEHMMGLDLYQERITTAIQGGHTFHAVEDDEE